MIRVKLDNTNLNMRIKKQTDALDKLSDLGIDKFRALTPIKSGNARSNTDLTTNKKFIVGDYPYAQRLENNWSKQTRGQGIVKPFTNWWVAQINRISRIK
jgi:hypothetical protein